MYEILCVRTPHTLVQKSVQEDTGIFVARTWEATIR